MTYNYVISGPSGTYPVTGIAEPPDVYATLLPAGFSIVSYEQVGGTGGTTMIYPVYRLIIKSATTTGYESGATYPGCTRDTPGMCHALSFATIQDAFFYAYQHNEIPVIVQTADEAWNIADAEERARQLNTQYTGPSASPPPPGFTPPPPSGGLVTTLEDNAPLILGALAIWFLAKK